MQLSQKQNEIIRGKLKAYNIAVGVTGSGKSFAMNIRFYSEICRLPENHTVMLTGNTNDSLYKNVITELLKIDAGIGWLEYTRSPSRIKTKNGVEVFCIGVNNEGADNRIQGGSVELWYADEPTTYPKTAYDMCLSRCRGIGLQGKLEIKPVLMTLNPDDDQHFIKKDIIDRRETMNAAISETCDSSNREYQLTTSVFLTSLRGNGEPLCSSLAETKYRDNR